MIILLQLSLSLNAKQQQKNFLFLFSYETKYKSLVFLLLIQFFSLFYYNFANNATHFVYDKRKKNHIIHDIFV